MFRRAREIQDRYGALPLDLADAVNVLLGLTSVGSRRSGAGAFRCGAGSATGVCRWRPGGRVYESWDDGTQVDWGTLRAWEPPERFVMSWNITSVTTEVELQFTALGPALTRVAVEHRGWEALTEEQLAADCALPGGYAGGSFERGWARILACFAAAADDGAPDGERPPRSRSADEVS